MALTAFLGGVGEAMFLVLATRIAFAITAEADHVAVAGWSVATNRVLWIALGLVAIRILLAVYVSWQSAVLASTVVATIRGQLSRAFLGSSWEIQQKQRAGSLQELLTTYSSHASSIMSSVSQVIVSSANLVALLGMAIAVNPVGALILVVSVAILGSLLRPLRILVRTRSRDASGAGMEFATSINEVSDLGMELHVFHVQDSARQRVVQLIEQSREKSRRLLFATGISTPVYTGLAYLALLGGLAAAAASESTSLTSLGAAMLVMLRSLSYGQAAQNGLIGISTSAPPLQELQSRLATFELGRRSDGGRPVEQVGAMAADNVDFAYEQGNDALRNLSFTIEPREIVGIVGPSGSGKSTLVQLLLGLRDPTVGQILVNGQNLASFDKAQLARRLTFVPQAAHLLAGTVADNIRFFRDDVDLDAVERASRLAHLHEDIVGFPEGYERQVGEHGGHLSGGQQQRLCIARALVEDPDVLIMDEPTSALDVKSEHLIRTTLLELRERMTIIIIAHRLSTLDICDRIMVIQDGELRGFDTPAALEQSNDFYREALILSGMR